MGIIQEQQCLKDRWDEQDADNTLKRKEKLEQQAIKTKEEKEKIKLLKEEEEKRVANEREYLGTKKRNNLDHQNELKKRWSEYEEDDDFCKQSQKENKERNIPSLEKETEKSKEEKENKKQVEDEKERKKQEAKECLRIKKKSNVDHQNELKKRWSEYEEDGDFCKEAQKDNETKRAHNLEQQPKEIKEKQ